MKRLTRGWHGGEKGFTLIELLVVVAILGILSAVVVPNFGNFFGRGQTEACGLELRMVQTATVAYASDNWSCPADTDAIADYFDGDLQGSYTLGGTFPDCTVTQTGCPASESSEPEPEPEPEPGPGPKPKPGPWPWPWPWQPFGSGIPNFL